MRPAQSALVALGVKQAWWQQRSSKTNGLKIQPVMRHEARWFAAMVVSGTIWSMRSTTTTAIVCAVALTGCQAMMYGTAADLKNLSLGMTRPQVIEALGTPTTAYADSDKREEYLIYRRMSHVVSWAPQNYQVTLRDGKVVRYGEQNTENSSNR